MFLQKVKRPLALSYWSKKACLNGYFFWQNQKTKSSQTLQLQFYIALYTSKHFRIYCHLPLGCFCTTPFGNYRSLHHVVLCIGLYFCLCLLAICITFPSLRCFALKHSFSLIRFLVPFHLYVLYLAFVSSYSKFLFQSFCITWDAS